MYYSGSRLASSNMIVYKAILKYGYSNFRLEILEYCEPNNVVTREQYYLDILKPEYNILFTAGSSLGYKHTKEALEKMSVGRSAYTGYKLSAETRAKLTVAATGRVLSEETKAKISAARMGIKLSDATRAKLSAATFKPFGSNPIGGCESNRSGILYREEVLRPSGNGGWRWT